MKQRRNMGVKEFKCKLCLNVDLSTILETTKLWLNTNCFQIKDERVESNKFAINSYTGSAVFTPFSKEIDAKRWLEIHTKLTSKGNYIVLYEKVSVWGAGAIKTNLIKDEVMALATFLQTRCLLSPQQQQQQVIQVNVTPPVVQYDTTASSADMQPRPPSIPQTDTIFCIHCGTSNSKIARFCKVCGATIE